MARRLQTSGFDGAVKDSLEFVCFGERGVDRGEIRDKRNPGDELELSG
jgi:hypothetical protein